MTLPDPFAVAAVVVNDPFSRTLTVRPAEQGYGAVLWRQAHRELVEDEKFRRFGYTPPGVPAHTPSRREVARGVPVGDGSLRFHFPLRDPAYRELVGTPLSAVIVVDRATKVDPGCHVQASPPTMIFGVYVPLPRVWTWDGLKTAGARLANEGRLGSATPFWGR